MEFRREVTKGKRWELGRSKGRRSAKWEEGRKKYFEEREWGLKIAEREGKMEWREVERTDIEKQKKEKEERFRKVKYNK